MVINTRYSKRRLLVARRTKEANGALFPYSWIGPFWKDFPFLNIILISFSDTIPYLSPLLTHICLFSCLHCPSLSISQITPLYFIPFPLSPFSSFNVSFFFSFGKAHYWFVRTIIIIIIIFIFILSSYKIFKLRWPAHFSGILFFTILIKFK